LGVGEFELFLSGLGSDDEDFLSTNHQNTSPNFIDLQPVAWAKTWVIHHQLKGVSPQFQHALRTWSPIFPKNL